MYCKEMTYGYNMQFRFTIETESLLFLIAIRHILYKQTRFMSMFIFFPCIFNFFVSINLYLRSIILQQKFYLSLCI